MRILQWSELLNKGLTAALMAGGTLSEARREAVYALACEFDFLIFEDDPYIYLQFGETGEVSGAQRGH